MVRPEGLTVSTAVDVTTSPTPSHLQNGTGTSHAFPARGPPRDKTKLKRELPGWQILMIGVGGVVGVTIFSTNGLILRTAGPAGLLTALCFVALTTICVMECIAELVVMWPVSNATVEYVKVFVDQDLGLVIGICYWYTMSSVYAILCCVAYDFASFWLPDETWRSILFFAVAPISLLLINCVGVKVFGWVEGLGGVLKIMLVSAGIIFMLVDAVRVGSNNIHAGFQHQPAESNSNFVAVCISIPLIAYGFIGTEIVAITAFEAKDRTSLRFPVRYIAYIISAMYLVAGILEAIVVNYQNCNLADLDSKYTNCPGRDRIRRAEGDDNAYLEQNNVNGPGYDAVLILSAWNYQSKTAAWFFNACIVYFCLSAANTALYVASRTLFGLTRGINRISRPSWYLKPLRYFGMTSPRAQVPHFALIVSAIAFFWLPYLKLRKGYSSSALITIMSTTGSIGGVMVWLAVCVAYIRYYHWFHNLKKMDILPAEFNRWDPQPDIYHWHKHRTVMASLRTIPAWIGGIGCFLIVFVFSSAPFWNGSATFTKVATAYAGPVLLTIIFIILKLWKRRGPVKLELTSQALFDVTNYFETNSGIPLIPLAPIEMVSVNA